MLLPSFLTGKESPSHPGIKEISLQALVNTFQKEVSRDLVRRVTFFVVLFYSTQVFARSEHAVPNLCADVPVSSTPLLHQS